jgi:hypothetical protein
MRFTSKIRYGIKFPSIITHSRMASDGVLGWGVELNCHIGKEREKDTVTTVQGSPTPAGPPMENPAK